MIRFADAPGPVATGAQPRNILKMVHNPRMAGSVPAWEKPASAADSIVENLARAESGSAPGTFEAALSYRMESAETPPPPDAEFTPYDLLDMINPLQHIPIVGHFYRELTGDEIKPVARIIGGTVFGGAAGAAAGIVNVIAEQETGKDVTSAALGWIAPQEDKKPGGSPEQRLASVLNENAAPPEDLPAALLAFTAPAHIYAQAKRPVYERD